MNINRVAIDTMGKADDPQIGTDIERETYVQDTAIEIGKSGELILLMQSHLNDKDFYLLEDEIADIYCRQKKSIIHDLIERAIFIESEIRATEKFGA